MCATVDKIRATVEKLRATVEKIRATVEKARVTVDKLSETVIKICKTVITSPETAIKRKIQLIFSKKYYSVLSSNANSTLSLLSGPTKAMNFPGSLVKLKSA